MIASILRKSTLPSLAAAALGLAALALSGCSLQTTATPSATVIPAVHGTVMGGETPIASSNLILWETDPGNTGYGLAATKLATATGSSPGGSFSFTTGYTCAPGSFVYLTSTGGDVSDGAPTPIINDNVVLIAALGSCSNFATSAQQGSVSVIINELSTVAAAYTLDNFMTVSPSATGNQLVYIGAPANNNAATGACTGVGSAMTCTSAGLAHAFANAANLVSDSSLGGGTSGQAYTTVPGNTLGSVPQAEINSLANMAEYCVNSPGGVSGDLSPCGSFFADATPPGGTAPVDTLSALVDIARFPRAHVGGLYGLVSGTPAFLPDLTAEPHDWSLAIAYSGTNTGSFGDPQYLALDANDNVYVETSDKYAATELGVAAMTSSGTGIWNNALSTNLCVPGSLATDTNGYVWLTVAAISTSGCPQGIYGYSAAAGGTAAYSFGDVTPYNIQGQAYAVSFDRLNNLWYGRKTSTCTTFCAGELPFTAGVGGAPGTYAGPTNIQTNSAVIEVSQIVIDAAMNIWVSNTITTAGTDGTLYVLPNTSPTTPNAPTYPATPGFITQALPGTASAGIALDAAGNVWSGSKDAISEFTPTTSASGITSFGAETDTAMASTAPYISEIDGNGLYWYGNLSSAGALYYQILPASPFYSTTAANNTNFIEPCYAPSGTTTCNAAAALPTGVTTVSGEPRDVQVDSTGALWVAAQGSSTAAAGFVLQVLGQASPTWPQLSYGVFATEPH